MMANELTSLLQKFSSEDKDHRYMATSDLLAWLQKREWHTSLHSEDFTSLCDAVVKQLEDTAGDISALAVKCLVALTQSLHWQHLNRMLDALCKRITAPRKAGESCDATCIGLKAFLSEVPPNHAEPVASTAVPVLGKALVESSGDGIKKDCLEAMFIILTRFGAAVKTKWNVMEVLLSNMDARFTKKATASVPLLAVHLPDDQVARLMDILQHNLSPETQESPAVAQAYMQVLGGCSKTLGYRFGRYVARMVPLVIQCCMEADEEHCDMKETALNCLGNMAQFCTQDFQGELQQVLELALSEIAYDPNLVDDDGGMDLDDPDDDDDEEEDDDDDDYGDEEDLSWKVRRAAAQLLATVFPLYPDRISDVYRSTHAVLIARFREREEAVKLDVLQAYCVLVQQTGRAVLGDDGEARPSKDLQNDAPGDVGELVRWLKTKSVKLKGAVLEALGALLKSSGVCGGPVVTMAERAHLLLTDATATNVLKIQALKVLSLAFVLDAAEEFVPRLSKLAVGLYKVLQERYFKVVVEAVGVVERAAVMVAAGNGGEEAEGVMRNMFTIVLERLKAPDQDQEVKEAAIRCISTMVTALSSSMAALTPSALPVLLDKLNAEGMRLYAVRAFGVLAEADPPIDMEPVLPQLLTTLASFLRKVQRGLRHASLDTTCKVMQHHGHHMVQQPALPELLTEARALVNESDLLLAATTLKMCAAVVQVDNSCANTPAVHNLLESAVQLCCSPLLSTATRTSLELFFCTLSQAGSPELSFVELRTKLLQAGENCTRAAQRGVAACVASLCANDSANVASTLEICISTLKKDVSPNAAPTRCLVLLLLGELGRVEDLSSHPEVDDIVTKALTSESEEEKATASLALGGVAVGNLGKFLPMLLNRIVALKEQPADATKELYLLFKALNEVLRTLLAKQVPLPAEQHTQMLQLLETCTQVDEESLTMVSDCLAQLAFMAPESMQAWLAARLTSEEGGVRAVVVAAIKHLVHDSMRAVPPVFAQNFVEFVRPLSDSNPSVRKEAVHLFNASAHTRPEMLKPCLPTLLDSLLAMTHVDPSLVRKLNLGPFQQTMDEGLGMRKHAYESMEALLSKPIFHDKMDWNSYPDVLVRGLADDAEIKKICHSMITQLCVLAPSVIMASLERMIPPLQKALGQTLKDTAVQQEKERYEDMLRSTLSAVLAVSSIPQVATTVPAFQALLHNTVYARGKEHLAHLYTSLKSGEK